MLHRLRLFYITSALARNMLLCVIAIFSWSTSGKTIPEPNEDSPQSYDDATYEFGVNQVERMLNDRIFMSAYPSNGKMKQVTKNDTIFVWMARQFASGTDGLIYWNPDPPMSFTMSDSCKMSASDIGYIRVRKDFLDVSPQAYVQFEMLWYGAAFESISVRMFERWNKLYEATRARKITRDEFVLSAAQIEFDVSIKTKDFYYSIWLPWAKAADFKSEDRIWHVDIPPSFDKWIAGFTDKNGYPERPFGRYYDLLIGAMSPAQSGTQSHSSSSLSP